SSTEGLSHIKAVLKAKYRNTDIDIDKLDKDEIIKLSNPFFGGSHELIIPGRHYKEGAKYSDELASSGELSIQEHNEYFKFTVEAITNILYNNRFVRYVSVFQNWLEPAGASFKHLHKQLVGLDEWGISIENEIIELRRNKNLYNEFGTNFALYHDFIFAENDYAVAFADYGHRYPTVAIYSKSINSRPYEHTKEEIQGMSDLVHSIHKAMGSEIACNEEWYYTPVDAIEFMPWHILIKWRTITPAGFEGGTKIYINPVSPIQVRDTLVPKLFQLRENGQIPNIRIAEECQVEYNMLNYYKYRI
ncbi:MAG: DUF4921 family protein, partial [Spirochaetota bacterium]